jgi:hypothetical protein
VIRWILSHTFGLLPIPGVTILFLGSLVLFWYTAIRPLRRKKWNAWTLIRGMITTGCALVFLFQFLWGFNYARPAWDQRLGLELQGMTALQLADEYQRTTDELIAAGALIRDVTSLNGWSRTAHEQAIVGPLREVLKEFHFPLSSRPRVRIVRPKGILMRWNTAGIYVPFSGEGHVDDGMLPVQIPFTLAHEMSHGYGVTDEADCNFLAYLACQKSQDPQVRFAGIFGYWRYVAGEYRYQFPDDYAAQYDNLPPLIRELLAEIRTNDARYPDLLPKLRNQVYDTYLRTQGIPDGLQSYSRVVQLVWAYENRLNKEPQDLK